MDREQFDALTRLVTTAGSRRALLAAALAAVGLAPAAAANRQKRSKTKQRGKAKRQGNGAAPGGQKRGAPQGGGRQCTVDGDCPHTNEACCDGHCLDIQSDPAHCGSCVRRCAPSETCLNGTCVFCDVCTQGQPTCPYNLISAAVANAQPGATIRVCRGTYRDRVRLTKNLTVLGIGGGSAFVTLDGGKQDSQAAVLTVTPGVTATVSNLTITGGVTNRSDSGGGVSNYGTLTLDHVQVQGNDAANFNGGGIANFANASLTLESCQVLRNQAANGGGVSNASGAGVIVRNTQINQNEARVGGGGIANAGGQIDLDHTDIDDNTAHAGGGIQNERGTVRMLGFVSLDGNAAKGGHGVGGIGGGINNFEGTLNVGDRSTPNTITKNRAEGNGEGGGVFNRGTITGTGLSVVANVPDNCVNEAGGSGCPA